MTGELSSNKYNFNSLSILHWSFDPHPKLKKARLEFENQLQNNLHRPLFIRISPELAFTKHQFAQKKQWMFKESRLFYQALEEMTSDDEPQKVWKKNPFS